MQTIGLRWLSNRLLKEETVLLRRWENETLKFGIKIQILVFRFPTDAAKTFRNELTFQPKKMTLPTHNKWRA